MWRENDGSTDSAQNTPVSSQLAHQWYLRVMAQEAKLEKMAKSDAQHILARNDAFQRSGITVGDRAVFYK